MSRPTDWSVVGWGSDPTPGDVAVVRGGGRSYTSIAEALGRAATTLRALDAGVSNAESVTALLDGRDEVVSVCTTVQDRYRVAGDALTTYAGVLEQVQSSTVSALASARVAQADADDDARLAAHYERMAARETDPSLADEAEGYRQVARRYRASAAAARARVASHARTIDQAVADRDAAANRAADRIDQAVAADGMKDTWWDDWGAKVVAWIAKVADLVSSIAGILALVALFIPVIGPALAAVLFTIAAVAAVVGAIAHVALAATGEQSWGEAIFAIGMAVLACVGAGAARAAVGGLKTGITAAAGGWREAGGLAGLGGFGGLAGATARNAATASRLAVRGVASKLRSAGLLPGRTGVQSTQDIGRWLGDINPNHGLGPVWGNNCGSCTANVHDAMSGLPVKPAGAYTLSIPEMEARTGAAQVQLGPSEIEQRLIDAGPGSHAVVGIDRADDMGHWFNAYYDGTSVHYIDGQTAEMSGWPPIFDNVTNWDASIFPAGGGTP